MSAITVGIIVFNDIIPFHLSVPCAVFEKATGLQGEALYNVIICATEPSPLCTNAGFSIIAQHALSDLALADIVIVPSWSNPEKKPSAELIHALQQAYARRALVVGLCMGAFVLAEAGLLHGHKVTTHWQWAAEFSKRYPSVNIDKNVLYVDDGNILTSAGTAASMDCCLYLIRRQCGVDIANNVARQLVVPPHRQGGQAQFIEQPVYNTHSGDLFMEALTWASEHVCQAISLETLRARTVLSRRSFTRRFQQVTGTTFSQWLLHQRLSLAQRFLEKTDQPIEQIAINSGFASALSLRRHFREKIKTTPSLYRKTFYQHGG